MAACSIAKSQRNMKRELHRLASFAKSSIHQVTLPSPLASAGLYYIHEADSVACFSCDWCCKIGDLYNDPVEQHRKESPRCDATGNNAAGNIPFGSRMVEIDEDAPVPSGHDDLASGIQGDLAADGSIVDHVTHYHSPDSSIVPSRGQISNVANCVQVIGPPKSRDEERRQRMKHEDHRLATFSDWPVDCPVSKEAVAKTGLYYIGPYDRVRCGFCYNVLKRWESGDVPHKEHKKYFPRCPFILNPDTCGNIPMETSMATTQEETEMDQMMTTTAEDISPDRARLLTENRELRDARMCKICMEHEANTVILPCGHLLACGQCALQLTSCPACRQVIKGTVNTYLS